MSTLSSGIIGGAVGGTLAGLATSALGALLSPVAFRSIGNIVAPCTLAEHHSDTLTITDHPVEIGAQISDHAFLNPVTVDIVVGWGSGLPFPLTLIYEQLLQLQASRIPFKIVTGKRRYESMLMESIEVSTDADTENILRVFLRCIQIIIVSTSATALPKTENQANPQNTAETQNRGTAQTVPANPAAGGSAVIGRPQ